MSHPSWVRGLKHGKTIIIAKNYRSHPSWVRGLKPHTCHELLRDNYVAPLVGAWIETLWNNKPGSEGSVAPLVGAWIETHTARH